ncbi:MAG: hypothetical protein U5K70_06520 [Halodesulfurarchaeum sp.]|nr:hypothetical protein [Halodesulfurarchaeum sp.]
MAGSREVVLIPRIGSYPGHALSTGLLVFAILVVSALFFRTVPVEYGQIQLLVIGAAWVGMTVGFEFLVGWAEGTPVSVTLGQYNVLAGQVWIAVPLTLLVAPLLFGWYLAGWNSIPFHRLTVEPTPASGRTGPDS